MAKRSFVRKLAMFGAGLGAIAIIAAAAGQALGPVLAGSAGGNVGVVASQNLFFTSVDTAKGHNGDIDQAAANIDTAGLIVTGAFRMHRGDSESTMTVTIENRGDNKKSAELRITRPSGIGVDLFSADPNIGIAQASITTLPGGGVEDCYLLTVEGEADGDIEVLVRIGTADPLGSHTVALALNEVP
jgi:hypothetical protein